MTKLWEREVMCAEVLRESGVSKREIARELGVCEGAIRYRLKRREKGWEDGRGRQVSACAGYAGRIAEWVASQGEAERPESMLSLYEQLVSEEGYGGSYRAVVRYVGRHFAKPRVRPKRRVETASGAQSQVDWISRRVYIEDLGGEEEVHAFVMVLSRSRMWSVVWSLRQDLLSWIECHNGAFEFLKGVTRTVRIDNLKTGVSRGGGPWAVLNEGYRSYAEQMGFVIDPCRIRQASDKGKVERRGRDVKWLLVRAGEKFQSMQDLQTATEARILERAKRWECPVTGKSIHASWLLEEGDLQPLPAVLPRPFDVQVSREVGADCVVNFEGRQYSVPFQYTGRCVCVRGCPGRVEIYAGTELLAVYPRGTDCRLLIDQRHYEGEGNEFVMAPTPLGRIGRELVLEKSWEAPIRSIDCYEILVRSLS